MSSNKLYRVKEHKIIKKPKTITPGFAVLFFDEDNDGKLSVLKDGNENPSEIPPKLENIDNSDEDVVLIQNLEKNGYIPVLKSSLVQIVTVSLSQTDTELQTSLKFKKGILFAGGIIYNLNDSMHATLDNSGQYTKINFTIPIPENYMGILFVI